MGDANERERLETEERTLLNDLYVQTGIAKCGPAQDHIQLLLEHDEKFLVFAHHKHVMVRVLYQVCFRVLLGV